MEAIQQLKTQQSELRQSLKAATAAAAEARRLAAATKAPTSDSPPVRSNSTNGSHSSSGRKSASSAEGGYGEEGRERVSQMVGSNGSSPFHPSQTLLDPLPVDPWHNSLLAAGDAQQALQQQHLRQQQQQSYQEQQQQQQQAPQRQQQDQQQQHEAFPADSSLSEAPVTQASPAHDRLSPDKHIEGSSYIGRQESGGFSEKEEKEQVTSESELDFGDVPQGPAESTRSQPLLNNSPDSSKVSAEGGDDSATGSNDQQHSKAAMNDNGFAGVIVLLAVGSGCLGSALLSS